MQIDETECFKHEMVLRNERVVLDKPKLGVIRKVR